MGERPEEKEPIKVVDRRSFTADGRRRDPDPAPESDPPPAADAVRGEGFTMEPGAEPQEPAGAHDPDFVNLVVSLYQSGCIHLGLVEEPGAAGQPPDFDAARGVIEMLAMVQRKTKGNLSGEEGRILDGLLAELRMAYVMKAPKT